MAIRFAPACDDDFERLFALRLAAMRESLERIGRFDPDRARERFASGFAPAFMKLIHDDEGFAGCVTVRSADDGVSWIEHFYIFPERQGRGLGAAVMAMILADADEKQHTLRLGVLRESDANRFYARHGFVETHREEWDIYYERSPQRAG